MNLIHTNSTILNANYIDFTQEINDIDNYIAILEALNQAANSQGYSFKKAQ